MERNNERKRRKHRLQGSELEKEKTIIPPNSSDTITKIENEFPTLYKFEINYRKIDYNQLLNHPPYWT